MLLLFLYATGPSPQLDVVQIGDGFGDYILYIHTEEEEGRKRTQTSDLGGEKEAATRRTRTTPFPAPSPPPPARSCHGAALSGRHAQGPPASDAVLSHLRRSFPTTDAGLSHLRHQGSFPTSLPPSSQVINTRARHGCDGQSKNFHLPLRPV